MEHDRYHLHYLTVKHDVSVHFKSFKYKVNRAGDRAQSCGDPVLIALTSEKTLLQRTLCVRLVRKFIINKLRSGLTSNFYESSINTWACIVQKVDEKSKTGLWNMLLCYGDAHTFYGAK